MFSQFNCGCLERLPNKQKRLNWFRVWCGRVLIGREMEKWFFVESSVDWVYPQAKKSLAKTLGAVPLKTNAHKNVKTTNKRVELWENFIADKLTLFRDLIKYIIEQSADVTFHEGGITATEYMEKLSAMCNFIQDDAEQVFIKHHGLTWESPVIDSEFIIGVYRI